MLANHGYRRPVDAEWIRAIEEQARGTADERIRELEGFIEAIGHADWCASIDGQDCECGYAELAIPDGSKPPCSGCGGRRWANDENWTPDDPRTWDGKRSKGDGLIPCGFCNEGGWDAPLVEPVA